MHNCDTCFYRENCHTEDHCDHWSPSSEYEDTYMDDIIERGRMEFRRDWWEYLARDEQS